MSRPKKNSSPHITKAETRVAALESINPALDLGNGLTLAAYQTALATTKTKLGTYNTLLSQVDTAHNEMQTAEKTLNDLSERMLAGVAAKYGKNSDQYEQAGGVRKSERKKPVRKAKAPVTA